MKATAGYDILIFRSLDRSMTSQAFKGAPAPAVQSILFSISRCISYARGFASRMDLREVFATNLRRVRHERGLSQDDLAYEADISRSYLSQIEKGSFHVSLRVIGKLSEALKVEPAEFFKGVSCG
jgi:DNA-binding XRE family transcriptional regulator